MFFFRSLLGLSWSPAWLLQPTDGSSLLPLFASPCAFSDGVPTFLPCNSLRCLLSSGCSSLLFFLCCSPLLVFRLLLLCLFWLCYSVLPPRCNSGPWLLVFFPVPFLRLDSFTVPLVVTSLLRLVSFVFPLAPWVAGWASLSWPGPPSVLPSCAPIPQCPFLPLFSLGFVLTSSFPSASPIFLTLA